MESKKKKRLFIHVGDIRIASDIISAYAPINNPTNPTGVQIISRTVGIWRLRQHSRNNKELLRRWINRKSQQRFNKQKTPRNFNRALPHIAGKQNGLKLAP